MLEGILISYNLVEHVLVITIEDVGFAYRSLTAQRKMSKYALLYSCIICNMVVVPPYSHSHRSLSKQDKRDVLQKELMEALRKKSELADKVLELTEVVRKKDGELNQAFSK